MLDAPLWPAMHPGYQVALALAGLALVVLSVALWAWRAERRRSARRDPAAQGAPEPALDAAVAEPSVQALHASLSGLERFDRLQADLRHRLAQADGAMARERDVVENAVQLMKRAAQEMRLPETLHELYESLRVLPRKPPHAQQADREWHRLARIEPGRSLLLDAEMRHYVVDFTASGHPLRISGRSFKLSRTQFDELTLFDQHGKALFTTRVKPGPGPDAPVEATVMSYRPGPWVGLMVETRALMDERRQSLLMRARYRDVERMRADFGLEGQELQVLETVR